MSGSFRWGVPVDHLRGRLHDRPPSGRGVRGVRVDGCSWSTSAEVTTTDTSCRRRVPATRRWRCSHSPASPLTRTTAPVSRSTRSSSRPIESGTTVAAWSATNGHSCARCCRTTCCGPTERGHKQACPPRVRLALRLDHQRLIDHDRADARDASRSPDRAGGTACHPPPSPSRASRRPQRVRAAATRSAVHGIIAAAQIGERKRRRPPPSGRNPYSFSRHGPAGRAVQRPRLRDAGLARPGTRGHDAWPRCARRGEMGSKPRSVATAGAGAAAR